MNGTTDGAQDDYNFSHDHNPPSNESTCDESNPTAKPSTSQTADCQDGEGESHEDNLLDTVGAVCVDMDGHIVSAVSSGGIILKQPGRLGQVLFCHIFEDYSIYMCDFYGTFSMPRQNNLGAMVDHSR